MKQTISRCLVFLPLLVLILACGGNDIPAEFQQNEPVGFQLTKVTEGYGAVDDAYNSVDAHEFNVLLDKVVEASRSEFEIAQYATSDVINDAQGPVGEMVRIDATGLLARLIDPGDYHFEKSGLDTFYPQDGQTYTEGFYAFLDRFSGDGYAPSEDYISGLAHKIARQTFARVERNDSGKLWLNTEMANIVEDIQDPKFQDDFIDVAKLLTKALIQTDYPMWLPADPANPGQPDWTAAPLNAAEINAFAAAGAGMDVNTDMGNAVRGTSELIQWLNMLIHNSETRELVHDMLMGFFSVLDPSDDTLTEKMRTLVENLEDHFTAGGAVYAIDPTYSEDSDATYSDAELGQTIREVATLLQQLFVGSDRPQSMIASKAGEAPVYPLDLMNENLRSIGFNPDTIDVESSIDDLIRHDIWGRDRVTDPDAYPISHLESLLFLTQATANTGWKDGGSTQEVTAASALGSLHGHGDYAETLTLSDSLFSIGMLDFSGTNIYSTAFKQTDGNHLYRSKNTFTLSQVNDLADGDVTDDSGDSVPDVDYRFFYNQDYSVLQFLAGPGAGDLGTPDGGNRDGWEATSNPAVDLMNKYHAYAPNGLNEGQLAGWTMGWGIRACFGGEGPYYYADPNAPIVSVNGQSYYQYPRPDGKIYAYVSLDGTQYLYPQDPGGGDVPDTDPETPLIEGQPQRDNRYKAQWYSDSYMIQYKQDFPPSGSSLPVYHFATIDNSSGDAVTVDIAPDAVNGQETYAGRLSYKETVDEDDPSRACATAEEAFFKNYQWVMNEKKMVIVMPMYMNYSNYFEAAVFEILEANGWSGLANMRKFRSNHVWAKKADTGTSNIPGDYRMEFVSRYTGLTAEGGDPYGADPLLGGDSIYSTFIDCGNATPAFVGHNLPALYRLAFPDSAPVDRGNGMTDQALGSKEFTIGDANWSKRNAFVPILFSLLKGLRDYSPEYDPNTRTGIDSGMRAFLNQTAILIKPLFYYNKTASAVMPKDSWIPRVSGSIDAGDNYQGLPFLKSSADFYSGSVQTYYGSETERSFYQPAVMKTILNVLIDSDITAGDDISENRCNGLLPMITESSARPLSRFFKLFLNNQVSAPPLEQIFTAIKFTKGPLTEINETNAVKGMDFPEWMFVTGDEDSLDDYGAYTRYTGGRDEDIILDDILDRVVGHDAIFNGDQFAIGSHGNPLEGYGLANYPDEQERLAADEAATKEPWERFNDWVLTAADLLHEDSPYCISGNLLDVIDRALAREELYTEAEIAGFMYATGKLFGYYDTASGSWVYQGQTGRVSEMYDMLAERVPEMNSLVTQKEMLSQALTTADIDDGYYGWGAHYYAQLTFLREAAATDGLLEYLINTMSTPEGWGTTLRDLHRFVSENPDVAGASGELWPNVAKLLRDMGTAVGDTQEGDPVADILGEYGFQVN